MSSSTAFIPYFSTTKETKDAMDIWGQQPTPAHAQQPQAIKSSASSESAQATVSEDHRRAGAAEGQIMSAPEDQPGWEAPVKLDGIFRRKSSAVAGQRKE